MPPHSSPEPSTHPTDPAARLAAIEDVLSDLVTISEERLARIEATLATIVATLTAAEVEYIEEHLAEGIEWEGNRGIKQTVAAVNTLIEHYLRPMREDLDAALGLLTRRTYLGDGLTLAPSTSATPSPSRATPAERLAAVAEVVRNAATADVEKHLRSAVGSLRFDIQGGYLLADDVAATLLDAATARERMTEPEARALLRRLVASTKRKGRR